MNYLERQEAVKRDLSNVRAAVVLAKRARQRIDAVRLFDLDEETRLRLTVYLELARNDSAFSLEDLQELETRLETASRGLRVEE